MNNGISSDILNYSSPAVQPGIAQQMQYQKPVPQQCFSRQSSSGNRMYYQQMQNIMQQIPPASLIGSQAQYMYQNQRNNSHMQYGNIYQAQIAKNAQQQQQQQQPKRGKGATKIAMLPQQQNNQQQASGMSAQMIQQMEKPQNTMSILQQQQQQNVIQSFYSDKQKLSNSLTFLNEEKSDLIFRLFDCCQTKKREEKQEKLLKMLTQLFTTIPNCFKYVIYLVEKLQDQNLELFNNLKDLNIPIVFNSVKSCKPVFRNIVINYNILVQGFEYQLNLKEKKYLPLVSFICINEKISNKTPCKLLMDNNEIIPKQYGGSDYYYPLFDMEKNNKTLQHFFLQCNFKPDSFLTFLVIHFVEKKQTDDILREILEKYHLTTSTHPNPYVKTKNCRNCSFRLIDSIEQIKNQGVAHCPSCNASISFDELIFDDKQVETEIEQIQEDNKIALLRLEYSEQIRQYIKVKDNQSFDLWNDIFGDDNQIV